MKLLAKDAVEMLKQLDGEESIFLWFRASKYFENVHKKVWDSIDDDSCAVDEIIDEYVSGWIEEA